MNTIPNMKFPALEDVLSYVDRFPCSEEARRVLLTETSLGNIIQAVGDAGCMPDETVVVIDFAGDARDEYPESKIEELRNGRAYRFVKFLDKYKGALYLRFFI